MFCSKNPATNELLWEGEEAYSAQVNVAVTEARKAFLLWSQTSFVERVAYCECFAKVLENKKDFFAHIIHSETGKSLGEALQEVDAMIAKIAISQKAFSQRCQEEALVKNNISEVLRFRPHGVVGVLGPFNFPAHLPHGHIIPALLAGNTVVFKPSEETPWVGEEYLKLWQEVNLPQGVLNICQGQQETGEFLVSHPDVRVICFTGSAKAGEAIHRNCAGQTDKLLVLEMGGNNPLVITEVKNIDRAVENTITSAFATMGQRCTCARRIILPKDKISAQWQKEFLEKLTLATKKIAPAPLISEEAAHRCSQFYEDIVNQGGVPIIPLKCPGPTAAFVSPGIINVTSIEEGLDEEIFGPLLQVIEVESLEKALEKANHSQYGLSAGIFTDVKKDYDYFLTHIGVGIVNWNRPLTGASSAMPFGGIGRSGNSRPSAYFAADYCSYPVASLEQTE